MISLRDKSIALLIGSLLFQPMFSMAATDDDNGPVWYQFEVLVFQRIASGAGSTEGWASNPGRPNKTNAIQFTKGQPMKGNKPVAFRVLPPEERSLSGAWSQMRRSRDYRPLYHVAWRQPMERPDRAKPIYFSLLPANGAQASDMNPPKLEGTLKLSIKRYLHFEADIVLHEPASGSDPQASQEGFGYAPRFRHYRLQELRRMRSGKLYYIDHPVIGVLTIAKPYQPPKPEIVETPVPVPTIVPTDQISPEQPKTQ
jgi:hypothetical protein